MTSLRFRKVLVVGALVFAAGTSAVAEPIAFADYGSGTTIEIGIGKGLWQTNWGQGPWTWSTEVGDSLFDNTVSGTLDLHAIAPADVSDDHVVTMYVEGLLDVSAYDGETMIGTMSLSGTGVNVIDGNAERVIVDEPAGMWLAPFNPPEPHLTMNLDEATGVFAGISQVAEWDMELAGFYAAPLVADMPLQQNIFAVLGGAYPVIGGTAEFILTGQYVPEPVTIALLGLGALGLRSKNRRRS